MNTKILARIAPGIAALAILITFGSMGRAQSRNAASSEKSPADMLGNSMGVRGTSLGRLRGVMLTSAGLPLPGASIMVNGMSGRTDQSVMSRGDGSFDVADLQPGNYELVGTAPTGETSSSLIVDVTAGTTTEASLGIQNTGPSPAAPNSGPTPNPGTPPGFWRRLGRAYVADWAGHAPITVATSQDRRGTPPPISSPPFPAADWPIGGTPVIGAPDYGSYPLMQAINGNTSRAKVYGWLEVGANGSTNNRGNVNKGIPANFPLAYDEYPNTVQLDQFAVYYERLPNTVQKDHFDWGWRFTSLYGVDYRFTTAKGMLSQQLLVKNSQYGWDPVMAYIDLYVPKVAEGMDIRIGRYISLPDIEAQLAPNNYTYTHSILYTVDCYTQTGINATVKFNKHWTGQAGLSPGCDVMPWTTDAKLTGNVCATFTWSNGGDALNTCDNTINDGKYAYNNLTAFYETWYHKINAHWHTDTEAWYQYMKDVPNVYWYNGTDPTTGIQYASTKAHPWPEAQNYRPGGGASTLNYGAVCVDPRLPASAQPARCYAPEWAITNYIEHSFHNNQASLNIRNEYVDDIKGQRTGTPAKYEEHMVGFDFWVGSTITFRPELSYVHAYGSYGSRALDISPGSAIANIQNGIPQTGKSQALVLAADLIWHF